MICMDRQIWDPGTDKRLCYSAPCQFHHQLGFVTPIEIHILLRPHNTYSSCRIAVYQEFFVSFMPPEDWYCSMINPAIFMRSANVMPPWLDTTCHSFNHPHTGFLHR